MRNLLFFCLALLVALSGSSCVITNDIHFNKNFSGKYSMILDMSEAMAFMEEMGDTSSTDLNILGNMGDSKGVDSTKQVLNSVKGVTNADAGMSDEGVFFMNFEFDDVDALNAGIAKLEDVMDEANSEENPMGMSPVDMNSGDQQVFKRNKKTISYVMTNPMGDMANGEDSEEMDMGMDDLGNLFTYNINFTFDRKIKSVDPKGFMVVKQESKSVDTRMDFSSIADGQDYEISIQLK